MKRQVIRILRAIADRLEKQDLLNYTRPVADVSKCKSCGHSEAVHSDLMGCYECLHLPKHSGGCETFI